MRNIKKIIAVCLVCGVMLSLFTPAAYGVTNGVQTKINKILKVYSEGTYFTSDGKECTSSQSDNCNIKNIPSRGGLPAGEKVYWCDYQGESWSCRAFGNYVFYCLFGCHYSNEKNTLSTDNPALGDFVLMNNGAHTAIYLWEDADYYYVYDSNGDHKCGVHYNHAFKKSSWKITKAYHAYNYDKINKGNSYSYFVPGSGFYYLGNVKTDNYITASFGIARVFDKKTCTVTLTSDGKAFTLSADGKSGYLMAKNESTLTTENKQSDYSRWRFIEFGGGYLIENVHFPNIVLALRGGVLKAEEYNGSSLQIWNLQHSRHDYKENVIEKSTCTTPGYSEYNCVCGSRFYEYPAPTGHDYKITTFKPTASVCGYDKCVCKSCGETVRKNFVKKTGKETVNVSGISVSGDYVKLSPEITDEKLLEYFPDFGSDNKIMTATGTAIRSDFQKITYYVISAGDADKDGKLSITDARTTLRSAIGLEKPDKYTVLACDWDSDGKISITDARMELRSSIGLEEAENVFDSIKI